MTIVGHADVILMDIFVKKDLVFSGLIYDPPLYIEPTR